MRWLTSRGIDDPRPAPVASWWHKLVTARNVQQVDAVSVNRGECPVDIEEARETQACVVALPEHLRRTMVEEYLVRGTQEQKADALGIEPKAFRARRDRAHHELLGLFNDAAAGLPLVCNLPVRGRPPVLVKQAA